MSGKHLVDGVYRGKVVPLVFGALDEEAQPVSMKFLCLRLQYSSRRACIWQNACNVGTGTATGRTCALCVRYSRMARASVLAAFEEEAHNEVRHWLQVFELLALNFKAFLPGPVFLVSAQALSTKVKESGATAGYEYRLSKNVGDRFVAATQIWTATWADRLKHVAPRFTTFLLQWCKALSSISGSRLQHMCSEGGYQQSMAKVCSWPTLPAIIIMEWGHRAIPAFVFVDLDVRQFISLIGRRLILPLTHIWANNTIRCLLSLLLKLLTLGGLIVGNV